MGDPGGLPIAEPTAILLGGAAESPVADRIADTLLNLRPGLLVVFGRG